MLETYPQENMNTQAIRELTNELFNLKNSMAGVKANITNINSEIEALTPGLKVKKISYKALNPPVTILAGEANNNMSLTGLTSENETLQDFKVAYALNSGGEILPLTLIREQISETGQGAKYGTIGYANFTSDSLTIAAVSLMVYYTEE